MNQADRWGIQQLQVLAAKHGPARPYASALQPAHWGTCEWMPRDYAAE